MSFILDPNAQARQQEAAVDRFVSMSVTRNAGATISELPRPLTMRASMRVDDIEGTRPRALPPWQRGNFHETLDIEGAQPRPLHVEKRNHPALALTNADIEESAPRATRFRTQRRVDPIDPAYALPRSEAPPAEAPAHRPHLHTIGDIVGTAANGFRRDLHSIADIAGTTSNGFLRWSSRDSVQVGDIDGTAPRPRCVIVQGNNKHSFSGTASQDKHADSLQVKDINVEGIVPNGFHSKRRALPRLNAMRARARHCLLRAAVPDVDFRPRPPPAPHRGPSLSFSLSLPRARPPLRRLGRAAPAPCDPRACRV